MRGTFCLDRHDPDAIQRGLSEVDAWLAEADAVPFGKKARGLSQVKEKMEAHESARRNNRPVAMQRPRQKAARRLHRLIYRRHALRHGAWDLLELTDEQRGKTFLGAESTRKIKIKEAEFILRQLWKFGRSDYLDVVHLGKGPEEVGQRSVSVANRIKKQF